ncbi:glycosyltransferase [Chloroflexota bacterium]
MNDNRMKILQTFVVFSPSGGGTVDLLYKISKALADRGHEVEIYTGDHQWEQDYVDSLPEVNVRPFHDIANFGSLYLTPGMAKEVNRQIHNFDIVHLHCMRSFQNIIFHHYCIKYDIPYVLDTHGSLPRKVVGEFRLKWLFRWLFDVAFGSRILRDASRVVAETELGVNEYREFGISDDMIALIPPPFAVEEFSALPPPGLFRKKYKLEDKKLVTFLGRIHQIKGLDFLVKSFYELTKTRDDSVLVIVGNDDGYKPTLDSMINSMGISDRILFTGFLGGDDKLSALVDSDVVVQTSVYEQGAWAPIEAVLCGTPIIVTAHTGAGEDVKRLDAGYLVEYDNITRMAQLITKVFDEPAEARNKAEKAAKYVRENMSMAKRIVEYENLYRECIKESKQPVRSKK